MSMLRTFSELREDLRVEDHLKFFLSVYMVTVIDTPMNNVVKNSASNFTHRDGKTRAHVGIFSIGDG